MSPTQKCLWGCFPLATFPPPAWDSCGWAAQADANRQGGKLYLTADDSGAPYMDIFDGVSSFATWGTAGVIKHAPGQAGRAGTAGQLHG